MISAMTRRISSHQGLLATPSRSLSNLVPLLTRNKIYALRNSYIKDRFLSISGEDMVRILGDLGATDHDLAELQKISNNLPKDPTLPFRESRNGRFSINFDTNKITRTEFQPFILSAAEDFVRHDSGQVRKFRGIGDDLQLNTAFQALFLFKASIIKGIELVERTGLDCNSKFLVSTVFNLRTITNKELIGEPALEGVHSDGVDHTMTTFIGAKNITKDSGITAVHDMREQNAISFEQANPELTKCYHSNQKFLDTIIIVDHENKHSVSSVQASNQDETATRDMLIFFTRKPTGAGHVSSPYDSLNPHEEIPLSFDMDAMPPGSLKA